MMMHPFKSRLRKRQQGAAVVEFAIVLIPLIVLVMGVAEFGHAIYQYEALTKGTRNAARYLSTYLPGDPAYPKAAAQCLAVYGNAACTGSALVDGLTTSMVVVCDAANTADCADSSDPPQFANVATYDTNNGAPGGTQSGSINLVEVKIKGFPYTPIEPFFQLSPFNFGNIVTVMRQVS
ncbi:TadE/TadG family type IV pilus assembly protein [Trinickia caryophylli]|uniref:TadE-like protein n=1 Tax=Trinickia caryophylli TaxID=28094 RepID=A0A1X7CWB1_TRICW|nr:TadE/TadG family type IV pilus assembly protein [Trinickia caryophylli]WQE15292.1 TadE/TadG family type IV pilus assembly protein [Trinickia caryophylli]SMF04340.1 TadE-like protein [Trinickia caryophylli]